MSTTYKLHPTSVSTFGSTNLDGAQSFTVEMTGDETTLSSDGKPMVQGCFMDNISQTVSVEVSQNPKALTVGDADTLTLRGAERANGEGISATVITFTSVASKAVITSITHNVNHSGNSTSTINFRIVSADGTAIGMTVA